MIALFFVENLRRPVVRHDFEVRRVPADQHVNAVHLLLTAALVGPLGEEGFLGVVVRRLLLPALGRMKKRLNDEVFLVVALDRADDLVGLAYGVRFEKVGGVMYAAADAAFGSPALSLSADWT